MLLTIIDHCFFRDAKFDKKIAPLNNNINVLR